jgi:aspartyl-tRNA(Asn)/glutamyl-tRNA(Gln) amidotransferase subunit B
MKYADVSFANLFYGNMRFDVNVSVSKDPNTMGTRTETKNLNSFRSVAGAVDYEIARQIEQLEQGEKIIQETRGWDDDKQATFSQRSKEDAHDYRYFPDPDIPPIVLSIEYIENIKLSMPHSVLALRQNFSPFLDSQQIETLLNEKELALLLETIVETEYKSTVEVIGRWFCGSVKKLISDKVVTTDDVVAAKAYIIGLAQMVTDNQLSSSAAKEVLIDVVRTNQDPAKIAKEKNLLQVSDTGELTTVVKKVLSENAKAAEDVKNGEAKAIGFLVGQVMKHSGGKANPSVVQQLIKKQLGV